MEDWLEGDKDKEQDNLNTMEATKRKEKMRQLELSLGQQLDQERSLPGWQRRIL